MDEQSATVEIEGCPAKEPSEEVREAPVVRIRPSKGWVSLQLAELWLYRELLFFLAWRDIKVRYKQTALGATWAVIQPVFTMLVFSLFFGKLAKCAVRRHPLPDLRLRGPRALGAVRLWAGAVIQ